MPGRPKDIVGLKAMAIAAQRWYENFRPSGMKVMAGAPIIGSYSGMKAGHGVTNRLLRALFADLDAFEIVPLDADAAASLPGAGAVLADLREAV